VFNLSIYRFGVQRSEVYMFLNKDKAEIAYLKIKAALAQYKPWGNDKDAIVSFIGHDDLEVTYRLEHISSVSLGDTTVDEPMQIEHAKYIGRLNAAAESECKKSKPE